MATYRQFFTDVLAGIQAPATDANLLALAAVANREGLNQRYNPLNSVVVSGANRPYNSVGVQDYGTYANGVAGTIALLQGSHWSGVVQALREGNSTANVLAHFVSAYTWAPGINFPTGNASTVLGRDLGSGTPGSTGAASAPYPKGTLHAPLTAAQRATVLAWIVAKSAGNPHPYLQMTDGTLYTQGMTEAQAKSLLESGQHDDIIVDYYDNVMLTNYGTLPNTSVPNPVSAVQAVADFLTKLESGALWKRIGIGAMGALVIVFAAVLLFRNDIPKVIPV